MKRLILIALLLTAGCASTPAWWSSPRSEATVLDYLFWQTYETGSPFCGTYALLANYPAERAAPAIKVVMAQQKEPASRRDIIRAVSDFFEVRNEPVPETLLAVIATGTRDWDADVRKLSEDCLAKAKTRGRAEPGVGR